MRARRLPLTLCVAAAGCVSNWTVRHEPLLGRTGPQVERVLGKPDRVVALEDKAVPDADGLVTRTRIVGAGGPTLPLPDWSGGDRWEPGRKDIWCWATSTYVVLAAGMVVEVWAKTGFFGLGDLQLVQIERALTPR